MKKFIKHLFIGMQSRPVMLLLSIITLFFSYVVLKDMYTFLFLSNYSSYTPAQVEDMEMIVDGYAGFLVAIGVYLESKIIFAKLGKLNTEETLVDFLNEVAETNGAGLLLIGLFLEILTLAIRIPNRILDTQGAEKSLFITCFILSLLNIPILIDLIRDYIQTYFKKFSE